MYIYAGIDEAGYGPMFGPLVVGRSVFAIPKLPTPPAPEDPRDAPPQLWQRLSKAVCKRLAGRRGRIVVNDSKRLLTKAAGIKHLEMGCLTFAALAGHQPDRVDQWLDCLGETAHHDLANLSWYQPTEEAPWQELPASATGGEIAIARAMLARTAGRIGVQVPDLGAAVVFEDRFNPMVEATRSKAATSFTFVARHLVHIWERFGDQHPMVVVDRQGGRTRYRDLLVTSFPRVQIDVLDETPAFSQYRLVDRDGPDLPGAREPRAMTVRFEVDAEPSHMPVALASMISKYTRELLMARFKAYFRRRTPGVEPTAGYGTDAQRFWSQIESELPRLGIRADCFRRRA